MADRPVVLVVEDEPLIMIDAIQALEAGGLAVIDAYDGEHALLQLDQRPEVQALFTDVNMPGRHDGVALARLAHDRRPDLHILVTSGLMHVEQGDLPPAARFIPKPYDGEAVAALLHDLLRSRSARG